MVGPGIAFAANTGLRSDVLHLPCFSLFPNQRIITVYMKRLNVPLKNANCPTKPVLGLRFWFFKIIMIINDKKLICKTLSS